MRYQDREVPISRVKRLRKVTYSHFYIVETCENGRIVVRRTSEWFLSPNLCPSLTFFYSAIVSAHLQNSRLLPPHFLKIPNPDLASRKGGRYSQFTHFSPFRVTLLLNLPGRFASSPFHPDWNPREPPAAVWKYVTFVVERARFESALWPCALRQSLYVKKRPEKWSFFTTCIYVLPDLPFRFETRSDEAPH